MINEVSSDLKNEEKTLEDDINSIENDENILEIDDVSDIQDNNVDNNLDKNMNPDDDDIKIIEEGLEDKDDFSIEIDDEDHNGIEDEK